MSAMHFLHYCLIVLLCSLSVALCWPFKHRTGQKKLRMYERDPDFIGSTTNLLVKLQPHNPSRRKQGPFKRNYHDVFSQPQTPIPSHSSCHHTSSYTSMFDNTGPIEVFRPRKSPCEQEDGTKLIQCKSNKSQCIHEYMICDDHKNCDGGEDEDPGSCLLRVWILKWMKRIEKSIKQ
ncbi:uncharacterized protein LOC124281763 isoform X1 [Haliotis rubra]|uniref:uncharacterized protein LOC124281763 isoform X1 n=1 Tax=Haliotis rubra TaxID=36100 RepID=UPI001EE53D1C|nr:uncharacterized protein LOC124281763 isoform X1 [Haliotis rubra]